MPDRKRLISLILIMISVSLVVGGIAVSLLYRTAVEQTRERLAESAQSQARLIEAIARFDAEYSKDYPEGSEAATLRQIREAHEDYPGFGETGEFTLARQQGNEIVFLLSHRHYDLTSPVPVPFDSELAEPMRRALSGKSGTVIGPDYRGTVVVAAHEPVEELNLGVVAKIDLAEVRSPFVRAALAGLGSAVMVVALGSLLFLRISSPIITHLEEGQTRLNAILDNAVDGIITIDDGGTVSSLNTAAEQLFGYPADEVIGSNVTMLMPAPYKDEHDGYLANYLNTRERKIIGIGREVAGRRKDGTTFPMDLAVSEVWVGNLRLFTGIVRDITERKQAEEELRRAHDELEQRVEERTKELREAQERLLRQQRLAILGQLAGGVAHEIRNPLGVIKNAVYFLRMSHKEPDEDTRDAFGEIERGLDTSDRIVGELLDYARDEKPKEDVFALDELIDRVLSRIGLPSSIRLENRWDRTGLSCQGDADQIERILTNLMLNAVQAMPAGGTLTLSCLARQAHAEVNVSDTGVGIAEEELHKVFEPLYSGTAKGIGLGLAISKRYAGLNRGRLEVESQIDFGTTFRLILPLVKRGAR